MSKQGVPIPKVLLRWNSALWWEEAKPSFSDTYCSGTHITQMDCCHAETKRGTRVWFALGYS